MGNVFEDRVYYALLTRDGNWYGSNDGLYKTYGGAKREAEKHQRYYGADVRVVKVIPQFFDADTDEPIVKDTERKEEA